MDAGEVVKAYDSAELKESDLEAIADRSTQLFATTVAFIEAWPGYFLNSTPTADGLRS